VELRYVKDSDGRMLWDWANEPTVRQQSFSSDPIPWEHHLKWFAGKQQDPNCHQFIICNDTGEPVAQVRFDGADQAEVGICVAATHRGKGYGTSSLELASAKLFRCSPVTQINAYIKPDNAASLHAFAKAGYRLAGTALVKGQEAVRMILERDVSAT